MKDEPLCFSETKLIENPENEVCKFVSDNRILRRKTRHTAIINLCVGISGSTQDNQVSADDGINSDGAVMYQSLVPLGPYGEHGCDHSVPNIALNRIDSVNGSTGNLHLVQ